MVSGCDGGSHGKSIVQPGGTKLVHCRLSVYVAVPAYPVANADKQKASRNIPVNEAVTILLIAISCKKRKLGWITLVAEPSDLVGISVLAPDSAPLYPLSGVSAHNYFLWRVAQQTVGRILLSLYTKTDILDICPRTGAAYAF